jgi:hypothetical protein
MADLDPTACAGSTGLRTAAAGHWRRSPVKGGATAMTQNGRTLAQKQVSSWPQHATHNGRASLTFGRSRPMPDPIRSQGSRKKSTHFEQSGR